MGITGTKKPSISLLKKSVLQIKKNTKLPVLVGFGINSVDQVNKINKFADGCVIGSAIVKIIEDYSLGKLSNLKMQDTINNFLLKINKAC